MGRCSRINNFVKVSGEIITDLSFSNAVGGEWFFRADLAVSRKSGYRDIMPLLLSEQLAGTGEELKGKKVKVTGQLRSYHLKNKGEDHLNLQILATELTILKDESECEMENQIYLDGVISREPVYRSTPLGMEITDIFVAVRRPYGKADFIPCIAWSKAARRAARLRMSDRICILGRIQSRRYTKLKVSGDKEERVVQEVSIRHMKYDRDDIDISSLSC